MAFEVVPSELDLLNRLIDVIVEIDPDILAGWEVQAASWGYLSARANIYGTWAIYTLVSFLVYLALRLQV